MTLTRRGFFGMLLARDADRSVTDAPAEAPIPGRFTLDMLKDLPESEILEMVAVPRYGWSVTLDEGGVSYRGEDGKVGLVVLGADACEVVRLFDGTAALEQVAGELAIQRGWPLDRCRALVRETFLALTEREVYHPSGPPPSWEGRVPQREGGRG